VCGQQVYRLGWHKDLWQAGPNKNAAWHSACVVAWQFWNAPNSEREILRRLQQRRCAHTGRRLWKSAEIDHRIPLFRVWGEHRDLAWPKLLDFWGLPNLQVINRDVHLAKTVDEAVYRKSTRS
jgi:5-methylcytosine-specific restriction endonuclease McrA